MEEKASRIRSLYTATGGGEASKEELTVKLKRKD